MAESIRQPDELILCGNMAEVWRKFKQEFELYMLAAGHDGKPSKQKIALLLHVARKQAIEVYNTFAFSEEEEGEYESVIGENLTRIAIPRKTRHMNVTFLTAGSSWRERQSNNLSHT